MTTMSAAIIGGVAFFMLAALFWGRKAGDAGQLAAVLTGLGIFGTFLGISLALFAFDTQNIQSSVPILIEGMKVAFVTSVIGIFLAVMVRGGAMVGAARAEGDDAASVDQLLRTQLRALRDIRTGLVGEGDTTLLSQLRLMRQESNDHAREMLRSFEQFSEKLAENNTNALIEALNEVMRDFNAKINEQFGENFKHLNEGVGRMLEWQQEYKEQVETATESLKAAAGSLDSVRASMEAIEPRCRSVQEAAERLDSILRSYEQSHAELEAKLEGFAEMASQAKEALPVVEASLKRVTEGLSDSVAESVERSKEIVATQSQAVSGMQGEITRALERMDRDLQTLSERNSRRIEGAIDRLDKELERELTNALTAIGSKLASLSSKFADDYGPITDRLRGIVRMAEGSQA